MKRHLTLIMILVVALCGALAVLLLFRSELFRPAPAVEPLRELSRAAPGAEPPHVRGDAGAAITIEEFADFQCPPCRKLQPELKKIRDEYGARLRVVFRQRPLPIHEHAASAARAAEAAALQNRFWEMHDLLFEHQREWSEAADARSLFSSYARSAGLDVERFMRDMDGPEVGARILADQTRAESVNITGTPTLFLNGREIPAESMTAEKMSSAINAVLDRKGP
jgi:protein-disulfide isomerase